MAYAGGPIGQLDPLMQMEVVGGSAYDKSVAGRDQSAAKIYVYAQ
jgi:hypothetical protein